MALLQKTFGLFLLIHLVPCWAQTQGPVFRPGMNGELSAARLFIAGNNRFNDNILDRERGDATFIGAGFLLGDTTGHGRGIGRFAIGLGAGALLWEGVAMMPIYGQVLWYPFIRRAPLAGVRLDRLGIAMRFGGILGAWKHTDRGQLAGHTYTDLAITYPALRGPISVCMDAGLGMIMLKGPYTITEEGVKEDRRYAEFIYPRLGLSVRF